MFYVIAEPCVGVKDASCAEICPADCIHADADSPQMYINPAECIFCGQCEAVCPVEAIFEVQALPGRWRHYEEINAKFFAD